MVKMLSFLDNYYNAKFEYPKSDDDETAALTETWYLFLAEYDYNVASTALKKLVIDKPTWPPTPGELVKQIQKMLTKNDPVMKISGPEAWEKVRNAISKHSWFYHPEKVKEALPEPVLKAAEVTGLSLIANNPDSFTMNRFIKTYEQIKEHEKERKLLPGSVRKDIERIEKPEVKQLAERISDNNE
jgi:hypothetical protein